MSARKGRKRRRRAAQDPSRGDSFGSSFGNDSSGNDALRDDRTQRRAGHSTARLGAARLAVVTAVLMLIGIGGYLMYRANNAHRRSSSAHRTPDNEQRRSDRPASRSSRSGDRPPKPDWVKVGGVWRPPSDIMDRGTVPTAHTQDTVNGVEQPLSRKDAAYRRSRLVATDANPHVKSVVAALKAKKHRERLTSFVQARPFDRDAFLRDPKAYLETVEPGRAYQPAQPATRAPAIKRLSPRYQRVLQGDTVTFRVETEPNMPVSFHSTRLGRFENRLSSQTVQADADGIAEVQFTVTPGTRGYIDVLAASPVRTQQARFVLQVAQPKRPPKVTP